MGVFLKFLFCPLTCLPIKMVFKLWSRDPWGSLRSFQSVREAKTILMIILRYYLLPPPHQIAVCTNDVKAILGEIAGTLV